MLASNVLEDIAFEEAWAAEEARLRLGERHASSNFRLQQRESACEICHLEQPVASWFDGLGKVNVHKPLRGKEIVEEVCYCLLSAIVIHLHLIEF